MLVYSLRDTINFFTGVSQKYSLQIIHFKTLYIKLERFSFPYNAVNIIWKSIIIAGLESCKLEALLFLISSNFLNILMA